MAKSRESSSEMAQARKSDGIKVIFDQSSPSTSPNSSSSGRHSRGRAGHKAGRYRSSSSSSSDSRSASNSRSRSHPRCTRLSSRCRCANHYRSRRGRGDRRSSPSADEYTRCRSRSRSSGHLNRHRMDMGRVTSRVSRSPSKGYRSRSRSRSSGNSVSLSDKKELMDAGMTDVQTILGVETAELPECGEPIQVEKSEESKWVSEAWVRQDIKKTSSQSNEEDSDDMPSPKMSPKRKVISFSLNNSVVKSSAATSSCAKVTPRVDIYESRKPYGHWVPVKSNQTSRSRKHTLTMSH